MISKPPALCERRRLLFCVDTGYEIYYNVQSDKNYTKPL